MGIQGTWEMPHLPHACRQNAGKARFMQNEYSPWAVCLRLLGLFWTGIFFSYLFIYFLPTLHVLLDVFVYLHISYFIPTQFCTFMFVCFIKN
uniref:Uncharacterized protein n=1 Tax=Anguilla anguilla TaxID=7936 RepID=A0A0E9X528_ANGAN